MEGKTERTQLHFSENWLLGEDMAGWINIPLKRSDGVDFKKPLEKFIKNTFSAEVATENEDAIAELTKLRNTCVMQTLDKHESALEPLLR